MIRVRDLVYTHPGRIPALRGVDLDLRRGEWVALMGANGSGKTTLARCLNALLQPTAGTITVDELSTSTPAHVPLVRRRVGMVFQHPDDQLVAPTVESEVAFGLENHGVEPAAMHRRVDEVLARFDLDRLRHRPPHLLSGGERQRLAIASAMAVEPGYLVLDEPTALLDPAARRQLVDGIDDLWRQQALTILHITQSPEEAARAQRLLVLHDGRLVVDGAPRRVFAQGQTLRGCRLGVPFAVDVADAAGGSAADAMDLTELSRWLLRERRPLATADGTGGEAPDPGAGRLAAREVGHVYRAGLPAPVPALDGVDLDVFDGRLVGLIGPSGSGKTTVAQHLNGLLRPTAGQVLLDGRDIWLDGDASAARRQVGLVFQFPEAQLFEETVAADVAFGPRNHGCSDAEARTRAETAMRAVGLPPEDFGHRSPLSLSGGERRRAAIAGVLSIRPSFLVLDEPTAGLDAANEALIAGLLGDLAEAGHGLLLISHDMDRVAELCWRLTVMEGGRVRWQGLTRQTFSRLRDEPSPWAQLPMAMQLVEDLRRSGWPAPDLLTRAEALAYFRRLHPGAAAADAHRGEIS